MFALNSSFPSVQLKQLLLTIKKNKQTSISKEGNYEVLFTIDYNGSLKYNELKSQKKDEHQDKA